MFAVWIAVMFVVFQSGLWFIPGGLLTLGILNGIAAVALAMWIAAGSFEQERARRTLILLLMSRLNSWRIVMGKAVAVAFPTMPFLILGGILIAIGHPHLNLVFEIESHEVITMIQKFFMFSHFLTLLWRK